MVSQARRDIEKEINLGNIKKGLERLGPKQMILFSVLVHLFILAVGVFAGYYIGQHEAVNHGNAAFELYKQTHVCFTTT